MTDLPEPPYPLDAQTGAIELPWRVLHELYHLVVDEGNEAEAIQRVRALTGANERQAKAFVNTLAQRR